METYRVVLVDDQPLIRECIRQILAYNADLVIAGEADDGQALLDLLSGGQCKPDMVVLDISMPRLGGIETAFALAARFREVKVLILSIHTEREYLERARAAGVVGYVVKEQAFTELLPAIEAIRAGRTYFPPSLADSDCNTSGEVPKPEISKDRQLWIEHQSS